MTLPFTYDPTISRDSTEEELIELGFYQRCIVDGICDVWWNYEETEEGPVHKKNLDKYNGALQESEICDRSDSGLLHRQVETDFKEEDKTATSLPMSNVLPVAPDKSRTERRGFNSKLSGKDKNVQGNNHKSK